MEERREKLCRLLDCYGAALGERSRDVLEAYYADDLSLAEIAQNCGITRQGVHDALRRGEAELLALEDALGWCRRSEQLLLLVERLQNGGEEARRVAGELTEILAV